MRMITKINKNLNIVNTLTNTQPNWAKWQQTVSSFFFSVYPLPPRTRADALPVELTPAEMGAQGAPGAPPPGSPEAILALVKPVSSPKDAGTSMHTICLCFNIHKVMTTETLRKKSTLSNANKNSIFTNGSEIRAGSDPLPKSYNISSCRVFFFTLQCLTATAKFGPVPTRCPNPTTTPIPPSG